MKFKIKPLLALPLLLGLKPALGAYLQIKTGDTLSQIAEANYGNWIKWKDLWKLNESTIPNPNLIYPGQRLSLLTDEELAQYAQNSNNGSSASDAEEGTIPSRPRHGLSEEWRLLPLQNWEKFVFKMPSSVDPDGFDRRSKIYNRVAEKTKADMTIASDRIPILGEITHARSEYERMFLGDQVFIRPDETLQVGTTYSVTTGPQKITSKRDSRVGFGYDLTGKIRIIGVRDGIFIGTVTSIYYPIRRRQLLIPEVPDYRFPDAIPAPSAMAASVVIPEGAQEEMLGEEKVVYLDVGTQDGVKPGMIFRHYLHTDPYTNEPISAKDFLIESEIKVLSVQDKFSLGIILQSHSNMKFGDDLVALTDLQDFEKNQGLQTILQDSIKPTTVDDLDKLDGGDGLGEKEDHELKQLEKWSAPTPEAAASGSGVSDDEIMRVDTHDHPKELYEIGKEPAPNDNTNKPETANTSPSVTPTSTPQASPTPANTPLPADTTPSNPATPSANMDPDLDGKTNLESSAQAPTNPAPIQEAAPVPSAPANPAANPTASPPGDDPFATPTPSPANN